MALWRNAFIYAFMATLAAMPNPSTGNSDDPMPSLVLLQVQAQSRLGHSLHSPRQACDTQLVFDVGLPRTGTVSMCDYGALLGYHATHVVHDAASLAVACHANASSSACSELFPASASLPDMFCDVPAAGLGCQLAQHFPEASFILDTRTFSDWFPSARYWLCRWGATDVCGGKMNQKDLAWSKEAHIELYGEAFRHFCDLATDPENVERLCGDNEDHGFSKKPVWDEFGLTSLLAKMEKKHDDDIMQCVAPERLLRLDRSITDMDFGGQVWNFLHCKGEQPPFPADATLLPSHRCPSQRVFNVGLPRTGTLSMCEYGERLGFEATHVVHKASSLAVACHTDADPSACSQLFPAPQVASDMFCDIPVTGSGCQLAKHFPNASFILVTRTFSDWFPSARFWLCTWGAPNVCGGKKDQSDLAWSKEAHIELYGEAYQHFCDLAADPDNVERLCGGKKDSGFSESGVWDELGLTPLLEQMHKKHDEDIMQCVAPERLLKLDLSKSTDDIGDKVWNFLKCEGDQPPFPHEHEVSHKR